MNPGPDRVKLRTSLNVFVTSSDEEPDRLRETELVGFVGGLTVCGAVNVAVSESSTVSE